MFNYLPLGDENLEFVLREGVLGVLRLDNPADVVLASLDLLSKDLYLLLLEIRSNKKTVNHWFIVESLNDH